MTAAGRLRPLALIAAVAGGLGSVVALLRFSEGTPPFLIALFVLWVLGPFAVLFAAAVMSPRWSAPAQAMLYGVTIIVTIVAVAVYGVVVLRPPLPSSKPTAVFVLVAPACWVVMATAALVSRWRSRI